MSKIDKLIEKLRNNPRDANISMIRKILDKFELEYIWGKGDHLNVKQSESGLHIDNSCT